MLGKMQILYPGSPIADALAKSACRPSTRLSVFGGLRKLTAFLFGLTSKLGE